MLEDSMDEINDKNKNNDDKEIDNILFDPLSSPSNKTHQPRSFQNVIFKALNIKSLLSQIRSKPKPKSVHVPNSIHITLPNSTYITLNSSSLLMIKQQMNNDQINFTYGSISFSILYPRNISHQKITATDLDFSNDITQVFIPSINHSPILNFSIDELAPIKNPMSFSIKINGNDKSTENLNQIMPKEMLCSDNYPISIDNILLPSHFRVNALSNPDESFPTDLVKAKIDEFIANDYEKQNVILIDNSISITKDNLLPSIAFPKYNKVTRPIINRDNNTKEPSRSLLFETLESLQLDVFDNKILRYLPSIDYPSSSMKAIIDYLLKTIRELNENGAMNNDDYESWFDKINDYDRLIVSYINILKTNFNNKDVNENSHYQSLKDLIEVFFSGITSVYDYIVSLYDELQFENTEYENKFNNEIEEYKLKNNEVNDEIERLQESICKLKDDNKNNEVRLKLYEERVRAKQSQAEVAAELLKDFDKKTEEFKEILQDKKDIKVDTGKSKGVNRVNDNKTRLRKSACINKSDSNSRFLAIIELKEKENRKLYHQLKQLQNTVCSSFNNNRNNDNRSFQSSPVIQKHNVNCSLNICILILGMIIFMQIILLIFFKT